MPKLEELEQKIRKLIREHFPWDSNLHSPFSTVEESIPSRPRRVEEQKEYVKEWLNRYTSTFRITATVLIARLRPILEEIQMGFLDYEKSRYFFRIDDKHITKSPEGILEKMARKWKNPEVQPKINFNNLHELTDLGRFRIVVNFLSDLDLLRSKFEEPYSSSPNSNLKLSQQALGKEFYLLHNCFEDLIKIPPADRKKGERCYKGIFQPRNNTSISIEVQLTTTLQEAWDKKDHFLIYEQRRRGRKVKEAHEREIFAMSELLYLADLTFNRLKEEIDKESGN